MPRLRRLAEIASLSFLLFGSVPGCVDADDIEDSENAPFPSGKADGGIDEGSPEALGVLALVNGATETANTLKSGAHLTTRVATNIITHRNGPDGTIGTADDNPFGTLAELDKVPYVGPATLAALLDLAKARGLVHAGPAISVIFSPQPTTSSSNAKLAELIRGAQKSIDIAIYSYSDSQIAAALADRAAHNIPIRFLFDTANDDRKLVVPAQISSSPSGKLEAAGIDVRWVNQILHHKFLIVDGPRDDASLAATATVVMGSANWTATGGGSYDENTMVITGSAEIAAAYQHEFDILWKGSREFSGGAKSQPQSTANITVASVPDDAGLEAVFTSANFTPGGTDGTTWKVDKTKLTMADKWVAAIQGATTSIHIASTHLRMRPIVEALIAKKQAMPSIDIKLYLDEQEFISASGDSAQAAELASCIAAATTDAQKLDCSYNDYLFSKMAVDAGLDVKFKSYAFRWDASYAVQMHSKYLLVDGKELLGGSYNLSMNSEHGTFENALHVTGAAYGGLVSAFEANFASIWNTGSGKLAQLRTQIGTAATIPLVFDSMALGWSDLDALKTLIRANCADADSKDFSDEPASHKTCAR